MVWTNVNKAKPNWIYVINNAPQQNIQKYVNSLSTGDGINTTMSNVIRNVLIKAEGGGSCTCNNIAAVHS